MPTENVSSHPVFCLPRTQCPSQATTVNSFLGNPCNILLINFFGIALDFQKNCKSSTESSHTCRFPLLLTSHIHMVQLSQLMNHTDALLLTKLNTLVR